MHFHTNRHDFHSTSLPVPNRVRGVRSGATVDLVVWGVAISMIVVWMLGHLSLILLDGDSTPRTNIAAGSTPTSFVASNNEDLPNDNSDVGSDAKLDNGKSGNKPADTDLAVNQPLTNQPPKDPLVNPQSESSKTFSTDGSSNRGQEKPSNDFAMPTNIPNNTDEVNGTGSDNKPMSTPTFGSDTANGESTEESDPSPEGTEPDSEPESSEPESTEPETGTEEPNSDTEQQVTSYPLREWTSNDGRKAMLAFIRSDEDGLILANKNNKLFRVQIELFSTADQEYLQRILDEQK